jgi:hypothetical protein
MLTVARPALERRVVAALDASPSRIPVIIGDSGSGRTHLLHRLRERLGRTACQLIDVERAASTPERFLATITSASPFKAPAQADGGTAREAFEATLLFLDRARAAGNEPAAFLLDEVLELRTFESFPGLRSVQQDLVRMLAASSNRFVLSTRYVRRAHRLLRDATARFEVIHMPPLLPAEARDILLAIDGAEGLRREEGALAGIAAAVHALSDGHPGYARAIAEELASMVGSRGVGDPVSALTSLFSAGGRLTSSCEFHYELRLHRARGYGALKAILEILALDEPLTLTEIALRLHRTPGSTKDYLSWLEDVDLISSERKRYAFSSPLLRLWVRLYCRPAQPSEEEVAREVQAYALVRLPQSPVEPAPLRAASAKGDRRPASIIDID